MRLRIATLLAASFLAVPLLGRLAAVSTEEYSTDGTTYSVTSMTGLGVALLYSFGGLFVLYRPRAAALLFLAAGLLGTVAGLRTAFDDLVVWGVLALALAAAGLVAAREQPRSAHAGSGGQ